MWVLDPKLNRVSWRPVKVRGLGDDAASVAGDLRIGDRIVALGAHLLREGEQVRVDANQTVAAREPGRGVQQ